MIKVKDDLDLLEITPTKIVEGEVLTTPDDEIWVRNNDDTHGLSKQIIEHIESNEDHGWRYVDLACIGAACVNQAIKAIAVVRDEIRTKYGNDLYCAPYFSTVIDDRGRRRTRMMLRVIPADQAL